jgi:hypothetical protein
MVVDEQIRPKEALSIVSGFSSVSLTVFDEHICIEEALSSVSSTGFVCSDESSGSSWVSDFSDLGFVW